MAGLVLVQAMVVGFALQPTAKLTYLSDVPTPALLADADKLRSRLDAAGLEEDKTLESGPEAGWCQWAQSAARIS